MTKDPQQSIELLSLLLSGEILSFGFVRSVDAVLDLRYVWKSTKRERCTEMTVHHFDG